MEKSVLMFPTKITHRINPKIFRLLGVKTLEAKFSSKVNCAAGISPLFSEKNEIAVMYESAEILQKEISHEEQLELIKTRLLLRKNLNLPFLPKILDYDICVENSKIKAAVFLEPMGKSLLDILKDNEKINSEKLCIWLLYAARALSYMSKCGAFLKYIGPEIIFVNNDCVKFLDLDDVLSNPNWTIEYNKLKANNTWRKYRYQNEPILFPPLFTIKENTKYFIKLQTYFLSVSFISSLVGESFIKELNEIITKNSKQLSLKLDTFLEIQHEKILQIENSAQMEKIWFLLKSGINTYPELCPNLEELDNFLTNIEDISLEIMKKNVKNKCANCGNSLENIVGVANCLGKLICQKCSIGKKCNLCDGNHYLGWVKDLHVKLQDLNTNKIYKIYPQNCIIGNSSKANLNLEIAEKTDECYCEIALKNSDFFVKNLSPDLGTWLNINSSVNLLENSEFKISDNSFHISKIDKNTKTYTLLKKPDNIKILITEKQYHIGENIAISQNMMPQEYEKINAIINYEGDMPILQPFIKDKSYFIRILPYFI